MCVFAYLKDDTRGCISPVRGGVVVQCLVQRHVGTCDPPGRDTLSVTSGSIKQLMSATDTQEHTHTQLNMLVLVYALCIAAT